MTGAPVYACRDIVDLVTEYLEGGLAAEQRRSFERHVTVCPPCRAHLAQLRRVVRAAPALADDELPAQLREDILRAFADWHAEADA